MMEAPGSLPVRPWYREPWPWILMSGPVAVVLAGLVTLWIALANEDPLVVDSYYKQGLAINRVLERDQAAKRGGYRAEVMLGKGGALLRVHLVGDASQRLRMRFVHPTRAELDRTVELRLLQPGWYEAEAALPPSPRWRVVLEDAQGVWRLAGDWRVQESEVLVLAPK